MDALAWISGGDSLFPAGEEFVRLRAGTVHDSYSDRDVGEDWGNPASLSLPGAYISSGASNDPAGDERAQTTSDAVLVIPNPTADVQQNDRIRQGSRLWTVTGYPAADTNPWTGWRPSLVVRLEERTG